MSEDTADLTVTLKAGTAFSDPWIVVRGNNPDEVVTKLRSLDGVIEATLEAAGLFAAQRTLGSTAPVAAPAAPAEQAPPAPWGQTPAAVQQNVAPVQNGPRLHPTDTCPKCGQRPQEKDVFRKSDNKKFEFWVCPNQAKRDDGHYSEFRN